MGPSKDPVTERLCLKTYEKSEGFGVAGHVVRAPLMRTKRRVLDNRPTSIRPFKGP